MYILLTTIIGLVIALLISGISIALVIKARVAIRKSAKLILEYEDRIHGIRKELDELSKRAMNQAFRIAWLESKVKSKGGINVPLTRESSSSPEKLSITERRHRVLSLARRGWDVNSIANTLGTTHGEIELIIDLYANSSSRGSSSEAV